MSGVTTATHLRRDTPFESEMTDSARVACQDACIPTPARGQSQGKYVPQRAIRRRSVQHHPLVFMLGPFPLLCKKAYSVRGENVSHRPIDS